MAGTYSKSPPHVRRRKVGGLLVSLIGSVAVLSPLFGMSVIQLAIAAMLSCDFLIWKVII